MDGWRRTGSQGWADAAGGGRMDGGLGGTGSKTFLCPRLQDRAEIEIGINIEIVV